MTGASLSPTQRLDWLRLIRTDNVGPITFRQLLARFGGAAEALAALPDLSRRGGRSRPLKPYAKSAAEREIEELAALDGRLVCWGEPGYPPPLAAVEDLPPVIMVRGFPHLFEQRCLAIVGARNASLNGRKMAQILAQALGEAGFVIASGMARGIDASAHAGSLASGTIAVLAGGIDVIYPQENRQLYADICSQGAVISERPMGAVAQSRDFPRRNRIIAGLALGVVVVEAAHRSGSLITARLALEQGREVFAVPGSPLDPRCRGTNHLLRQGAVLTESAQDVVDALARCCVNRWRSRAMDAPMSHPAPNRSTKTSWPPRVRRSGPPCPRRRWMLTKSSARTNCPLPSSGWCCWSWNSPGESSASPAIGLLQFSEIGWSDRGDPKRRMQGPGMNVVVVESPAKARTINKYLGADYKVIASYGHVRDLSPKDGSVKPDNDFAMAWQVDPKAEKHLKEIGTALKGASNLYLATDPDREGEAISWHIEAILRQRKLLDDINVRRVVFNEVTASAVREAFKHPRDLDDDLVEAYLARRALDYLVGFTLSPVLWRKLPSARSAGRVQSVALRLICEREAEIEAFRPREYWSVSVAARTIRDKPFLARLTHLNGEKLDKFDLGDEAKATAARDAIQAQSFRVARIERKRTKRNPAPPFTTSTLQQEASRKLRFGMTKTMRVAQRLYEGVDLGGETVGLITYMRTDSVVLSREATDGVRQLIGSDFGARYLPDKARIYKTQAKNAQEAHEAIRPTDPLRRPREVAQFLDEDGRRLYDLIWRRTTAAQMASAELDRVAADLLSPDDKICLRAIGSTIAFDGFLKVYHEDRDEPASAAEADATEDEALDRQLPELNDGEAAHRDRLDTNQHFTQPPPRYGEASLVKKMEELGIGRPSTYASILQVLQDRNYVALEKRRFIPDDRGRLVTAFLSSFFERYVAYDFTAKLEEQLDDISGGRIDWKSVLQSFWSAFSEAVGQTTDLTRQAVRTALEEALSQHFFPPRAGGSDPQLCPACADGRLALKIGRHGPFIGCSRYPDCAFTRPLQGDGEPAEASAGGPVEIGIDSETEQTVTLRKGPFGYYLQLGEATDGGKPKRVALPKGWDSSRLDLATALALLALPREIGRHPEDGAEIHAGIGRYGPYLKHRSRYVSLVNPQDVLTVGINRAVTLLAEKPARGGGASVLRELGPHPEDSKPVTLCNGRYGLYVKHGRTNATLPKYQESDAVTLEDAVALIAAKVASASGGKRRKPEKSKPKAAAKGRRKAPAKGARKVAATKVAKA